MELHQLAPAGVLGGIGRAERLRDPACDVGLPGAWWPVQNQVPGDVTISIGSRSEVGPEARGQVVEHGPRDVGGQSLPGGQLEHRVVGWR